MAQREGQRSGGTEPAGANGGITMENSLLVGLSRQMSLQRKIDVLANNVANINTTGFKADTPMFEEHLMPVARNNDFRNPDVRPSFVLDRGLWRDFSAGSIQQTGGPLDVAIDGDGFLVVQAPQGERYTRNGALQVNANGQLVTTDGLPVLGENGPITLQGRDADIVIGADGTIRVKEGASPTSDSARGKLRVVSFGAQAQRLQKEGQNLFSAPNGIAPQPAGTTSRVIQGAIEKSNVSGVLEMTRLIEVSRSYQQVAQMIQQQSDVRRNAIDKLAEVPA